MSQNGFPTGGQDQSGHFLMGLQLPSFKQNWCLQQFVNGISVVLIMSSVAQKQSPLRTMVLLLWQVLTTGPSSLPQILVLS